MADEETLESMHDRAVLAESEAYSLGTMLAVAYLERDTMRDTLTRAQEEGTRYVERIRELEREINDLRTTIEASKKGD